MDAPSAVSQADDRAILAEPTGLPSTRLDGRTKLDRGWSGVVYPAAGEVVAVGSLISEEALSTAGAVERRRVVPLGARFDAHAAAPHDSAGATERAERRARGQIRRYAVANRCTRLLTLTYRVQTDDAEQVRRDFAAFSRRLRRTCPDVAWVRVLERHESGMLHVHVGLSRYVPKSLLADLWGHGFVDVRKIRAGGARESARRAARYLSKYVTKDAVADPGEHRYEVRQGRQPAAVRALVWSIGELLALAEREGYVSGEPVYVWESAQDTAWTGPPVYFAAY